MTERQILFSGPMVRALLDGRKSQTRRIVSPQPNDEVCEIRVERYHPTIVDRRGDDAPGPEIFGAYSADGSWGCKCPYGESGDRLWVREAWRTISSLDEYSGSRIAEMCLDAGYSKPWAPIHYEADGRRVNWEHTSTPPHDGEPKPGRYRHARFMPRWASRLTLEVTGVRVERLQHCSEDDAWAEGCPGDATWSLDWYRALWDTINGAGSWESNPFVWVIEFRRVN